MSESRWYSFQRSVPGLTVIYAAAFCLSWIAVESSLVAQVKLTRIDGTATVTDDVTVSNGSLEFDKQSGDINEFRQIDFQRPVKRGTGANRVELIGGGSLLAEELILADDSFRLKNVAGEIQLGVEAVTQIQFRAESLPLFDNARPKEALDQLFVKIKGNYQTVPGIVLSISDSKISILYEEDSLEFNREDAHGLVLAQAADSESAEVNAVVVLTEGSEVSCQLISLDAEFARATIGGLATVEIPREVISRIEIRSNLLAFLSDLGPEEIARSAGGVLTREWQKDRNIAGGILTLRDREKRTVRTFDKGLGTKSGQTLRFKNDGFDRFVALVGIDAGTNGNGQCRAIVSAGGKTLFEADIVGVDPPRSIDVDISGSETIELRIEYGKDFLDLSDHLNWCDARFVRESN